jgi:hypothetical protein
VEIDSQKIIEQFNLKVPSFLINSGKGEHHQVDAEIPHVYSDQPKIIEPVNPFSLSLSVDIADDNISN